MSGLLQGPEANILPLRRLPWLEILLKTLEWLQVYWLAIDVNNRSRSDDDDVLGRMHAQVESGGVRAESISHLSL